jgi:recombination protein RecT
MEQKSKQIQTSNATPEPNKDKTVAKLETKVVQSFLADLIMPIKENFLKVSDNETWVKEGAYATQALMANSYLLEVAKENQQSLKNAIFNLALIGITLNPVKQLAFLVPRKVMGKRMVCLDISYRGLAGIAMDSGSVKHITPYIVYTFDDYFSYEVVDGVAHTKHKKSMSPPEDFIKNMSGTFWKYLLCGYLSAILHDGTVITTEPHPKWKLEKAMKTSKTVSDDTPWRTHPDEMCMKTLVKHASKLMPQTDRLSQAVAILNEHEGIDTEPKQESKLEERLNTKVSEGNYNAPPEQPIGETKKEPEKIVEGVVISDAEAEAIRQREIKESRGNTVDIKKEGKLF